MAAGNGHIVVTVATEHHCHAPNPDKIIKDHSGEDFSEYQLIYGYNTRRGAYWAPLLEKAYAKAFGGLRGYGGVSGGTLTDALVDMTGGIVVGMELDARQPPTEMLMMTVISFIFQVVIPYSKFTRPFHIPAARTGKGKRKGEGR